MESAQPLLARLQYSFDKSEAWNSSTHWTLRNNGAIDDAVVGKLLFQNGMETDVPMQQLSSELCEAASMMAMSPFESFSRGFLEV